MAENAERESPKNFSQEISNSTPLQRCTWEGCEAEAKHPQVAQDGEVWANLCDGHNRELDASMLSGSPKTYLSVWIKAQGGANKAAERMAHGVSEFMRRQLRDGNS
jgi:hypothetical protein